MKYLLLGMLLFGCATVGGSRDPAQVSQPDPAIYEALGELPHFKVYKKKAVDLAEGEKATLLDELETGFGRVKDYLGQNRTPQAKLLVLLEGEAMRPNERPQYPSVDEENTIRLYRFPGIGGAYLQGLPHELVHAFRFNLRTHQRENTSPDPLSVYGFLEEGFAEFVTREVSPASPSFPSYGFPLEVVTGYWISNQTDIPLEVLLHHHEINPACIAQAYPLRASFLRYIQAAFGKEKLLELAYYEKPLSEAVFQEILGHPFSHLAAEATVWAQTQHLNFPEHEKVLNDYLTNTKIKYFPVCKKGANF